jgi:hypothetical protein
VSVTAPGGGKFPCDVFSTLRRYLVPGWSGNIFIADTKNHRLRVVSVHDGKINTVGGMPTGSGGFNGDNRPATDAYLNDPKAAAMASTRGARRIYISDTENNRIRMLTFKIERVLY